MTDIVESTAERDPGIYDLGVQRDILPRQPRSVRVVTAIRLSDLGMLRELIAKFPGAVEVVGANFTVAERIEVTTESIVTLRELFGPIEVRFEQ